jgi:hypothetical protein
MAPVVFLVFLLVALPLLAVRYGAESRPGFATPPDWRRRDS